MDINGEPVSLAIDQLHKVLQYLKQQFRVLSEEEEATALRKREIEVLEQRHKENREKWEREKAECDGAHNFDDLVKLNVGGKEFTTTRGALCSVEGTVLYAMFSGRHFMQTDSQGRYFIDRDYELFSYVLSYLTDINKFRLPQDKSKAQEVLRELQYFGLSNMQQDPNVKTKSKHKKFFYLRDLAGHGSPVGCLGVLCDGKQIVSGSNDTSLKIWDLESGRCEKTLTGHNGSIYSLKVHKDICVTGSHDKRIKVWDITNGTCIATLSGHTDRVWCLQLSKDGRIAVSGGADNVIKVWDLPSGICTQTLKGHRSWVRCVEIDDGKIYSGSDDNEIRIWEMETGKCIHTIKGHDESVFALTLVGNVLVSGAKDQTIRIWDTNTGQLKNTLFGHTRPVYCLQVINGKIISGSWDSTIRIWDLHSGKCLQTLRGHTKAVYSVMMAGNKLVTGSSDNTIKIWGEKETRKIEQEEEDRDVEVGQEDDQL